MTSKLLVCVLILGAVSAAYEPRGFGAKIGNFLNDFGNKVYDSVAPPPPAALNQGLPPYKWYSDVYGVNCDYDGTGTCSSGSSGGNGTMNGCFATFTKTKQGDDAPAPITDIPSAVLGADGGHDDAVIDAELYTTVIVFTHSGLLPHFRVGRTVPGKNGGAPRGLGLGFGYRFLGFVEFIDSGVLGFDDADVKIKEYYFDELGGSWSPILISVAGAAGSRVWTATCTYSFFHITTRFVDLTVTFYETSSKLGNGKFVGPERCQHKLSFRNPFTRSDSTVTVISAVDYYSGVNDNSENPDVATAVTINPDGDKKSKDLNRCGAQAWDDFVLGFNALKYNIQPRVWGLKPPTSKHCGSSKFSKLKIEAILYFSFTVIINCNCQSSAGASPSNTPLSLSASLSSGASASTSGSVTPAISNSGSASVLPSVSSSSSLSASASTSQSGSVSPTISDSPSNAASSSPSTSLSSSNSLSMSSSASEAASAAASLSAAASVSTGASAGASPGASPAASPTGPPPDGFDLTSYTGVAGEAANYAQDAYDRILSGGAVAGIVIGCVVFLILLIILIVCCCCKRRRDKNQSSSEMRQRQPINSRRTVAAGSSEMAAAGMAAPGDLEAGYGSGSGSLSDSAGDYSGSGTDSGAAGSASGSASASASDSFGRGGDSAGTGTGTAGQSLASAGSAGSASGGGNTLSLSESA